MRLKTPQPPAGEQGKGGWMYTVHCVQFENYYIKRTPQ